MNFWLIPTKPEHLDMCWATRLHGTNAQSGKAMEKGDIYFTYVTEKQDIVALCRIVEGPYPPVDGLAERLWDQEYDLVWNFEVLEVYSQPLNITWKGLPGGSQCKYGFSPPGTGPKKLTPQSITDLMEAITA